MQPREPLARGRQGRTELQNRLERHQNELESFCDGLFDDELLIGDVFDLDIKIPVLVAHILDMPPIPDHREDSEAENPGRKTVEDDAAGELVQSTFI